MSPLSLLMQIIFLCFCSLMSFILSLLFVSSVLFVRIFLSFYWCVVFFSAHFEWCVFSWSTKFCSLKNDHFDALFLFSNFLKLSCFRIVFFMCKFSFSISVFWFSALLSDILSYIPFLSWCNFNILQNWRVLQRNYQNQNVRSWHRAVAFDCHGWTMFD